jgi:hypothetical protein
MTLLATLLAAGICLAESPSELWIKGYSVIPSPRTVRLDGGDVIVGESWRLEAGSLSDLHIAVRALRGGLESFYQLALKTGAGSQAAIRLAVRSGAVVTGATPELDRQGYRIRITPESVEITGNSDQGLFYGVQTLVQLLKRGPDARLRLPRGTIEDWPTGQLRFLHWDSKHHQDRMETLKRYLDWSARLKVNMIGFELEDKFEYASHPVIGAPGAFTPAQLQEIVNYGLERFIQVVPVIQSPAHMTYVLKHPEFAALRADGNNYQSDLCDERTFELIFSMFDDVIRATKGIDYFFVSTDEVYYAGIGPKCTQPYNPVNRSLKLVEFLSRSRDHLARRGRKMLAWLEYPLLAEHFEKLPADIIDGVAGQTDFIPIERARGMRQLAYVSLQGSEFLFPDHLPMPSEIAGIGATEFERGYSAGRLKSLFDNLTFARVREGNPIGVFGAAWDDSGLHNETYWLGWSAVAQYGWTPGNPSIEQHTAEFMRFYYGPGAVGMIEIYREMQRQARSWQRTWDRIVSKTRKPGYGNSYGPGIGTTRYDLTLPRPALPRMPDLESTAGFSEKHDGFVAIARQRMVENDQLVHAIQENFARAERNHYNLEVMHSLAEFIGHHWRLLTGLAEAEYSLELARQAALKSDPAEAVGRMVAAHNQVQWLQRAGEQAYQRLVRVFEKSRYPKGRSASGKPYVHVLDDTKDHWADRTADLSFLIVPERSIGLGQWRKELAAVIREFAGKHGVAIKGLEEKRLEE